MANKLKELLDAKIEAELNALDKFEPGSPEHSETADNVVKLYKLKNDDTKIERYLKLGAEIAGIVLPLMFYGYWMNKGLTFEKTGSFTSDTFRGLIRCFKPVKK